MIELQFKLFAIIFAAGVFGQDQAFNGCELGWFRYKRGKCVNIFDVSSTFGEAKEYCETAFGANILNICSDNERLFWSFHLLRFSKLESDVWLDTTDQNLYSNLDGITLKTGECLALRSKKANLNGMIGDVVIKKCREEGAVVCEIKTNKKIASKYKAIEFNINEDYVPNHRLKFSNGSDSELFSGVYYVITSKFKNSSFSNGVFGNGKCSLTNQQRSCNNIFIDEDLQENFANYYLFTKEQDNLVQIRRFNSDKLLVYEPQKYISNFKCFEDGITDLGKELCSDSLKIFGADPKWRIEQFNNSGYYTIRSNYNNMLLGAIEYKHKDNKIQIGFGLYDESINNKSPVNDKLLFRIEPLNFTLDVELYSIEFDKSLSEIVSANKKHISLIDTAVITNESPATLTHEVVNTKELTETYSTSFGESDDFMESISNRAEYGTSSTDTKSKSKSFTEAASEAVAKQLSTSMSSSDTTSSEQHSSSSDSVQASAGFSFFGVSASVSYGHNWERGSSYSNSHTVSKESSQSQSNTQEKSQSNTATDDQSKSLTADERKAKEMTKQTQKTTDKRKEESGTRSRSYSIYKTVNLPPYSAVKISSYANWIDDMSVSFTMNLRFTVKSFRRKMNGEGTNAWRTMDSDFVKYLMNKEKFPGKIIKTSYDIVIGQIKGNMKASVGLESVFTAHETRLKN